MGEKCRADMHVIRSGENKAVGNAAVTDRSWSKSGMLSQITFKAFMDAVESYRGMTLSDDIKSGRVFLGVQGLSNHLLDGNMTWAELLDKYDDEER